jgi:two-component system sensor histidine kinase ResE
VALVAGFARSLADGTARRDDAEVDAIEYIQTESEHLSRVVDQLFALASLDADAGTLVPAPCRPDQLLQQTVARFQRQGAWWGATVQLECPSDLPTCLWDEDQVASALANLIGNALEHSGSQTVHVRAARSPGVIVLEVVDRGCGIAQDDLPHVFDRFYRGRARRSGGHGGLGLALVKEVVEAHGGSVAVRSAMGEGAHFTLTLPVEAPAAGETHPDRDMTA